MPDATTRRNLLRDGARMAVAGAAAAGLARPAGASAAATSTTGTGAEPPESEPMRLGRMLSAELLLLFSYEQVLSTSLLSSPRAESVLSSLRAQEEAHVRALGVRLTALGGTPPRPPTSIAQADRDLAHRRVSNRLGQLRGAPDALALLLAVERVTVGVYFVALTDLADPRLIRLVTEIMANDAQHEALLAELLYHGNVETAVPYGLIQGLQ